MKTEDWNDYVEERLDAWRQTVLWYENVALPKVPTQATLRRYGLSLDDWLRIVGLDIGVLDLGDGRCAWAWLCPVCDTFPPSRRTVVDHRHAKGWKSMPPDRRRLYVRGIVCVTCNHFILTRYGTPDKFLRAAAYLERDPWGEGKDL